MSMLRVESRESAHLKSRVRDMSVVPNVVSFTALLAAITPIAKLQRNADNTYDPILIRDTDSLIANFGDPDRKSTRLNSSHITRSRMPSSA